jgi:TolB-like protein/Tfp pilus assembly protein PilF
MVGYSALSQRDEKHALRLLSKHNELLRSILSRYRGKEVKTMGDAFLLEFESALDATRYAIDIQQKLREHNLDGPETDRIDVRIGIHIGDVVHRATDIYGDAVNIASRIEPLAEPDGICISQQVFDQVRNKVDHPIESLGPRHLKNIDYPINVYRITQSSPIGERPHANLERRRIAVLPFLNISPDSKDEYFSDGLTEELIARLSTISELRVIARTSVMRFKGSTKSVNEIGTELKSGTLLEGSVRKSANRIRVTAQLIDVASEEHLWAQNYDRQLEDVFAIQIELAENVTEALRTRLLTEEREHLEKRPTRDPDAYTLYLKGRFCWNERSRDSLMKAVKYFEEAITKDPEFALAYSGLADCYVVLVNHGYLPPKEGHRKARNALTKALSLDGELAEAHTSLGNILSNEWNWSAAESEFAKAIESNPNYAKAHHWYSIHLLSLGRIEEAINQLKIAEELDPLSPMIHAYAGGLYIYARRYDDAMKELDLSLELDKNFVPAHANRSDACLAKGMFVEALAELQWVTRRVPSTTHWRIELGFVYAISGRTKEAEQIIQECEQAAAHEDLEPQRLAIVYSKLGNLNRALECLEKAFEARSITPFQVKQGPFYDTITSDQRFEELVKKVGVTEKAPRRWGVSSPSASDRIRKRRRH